MNISVENFFQNKVISGIIFFAIIIFSAAADAPAQVFENRDVFQREAQSDLIPVAPIYFPENPTCKSLNDSDNPAFARITTDYELKLNFEPPVGSSAVYPFTSSPVAPFIRELIGPPSPADSVTLDRRGVGFEWTASRGISAAIVSGENGSNVYVYPQAAFGGSDLKAPGVRHISHVTFCYFVPAKVTIIKEVQTFNGGNSSSTAFPFTATNFTPANFSLVDNNSPPADRVTNSAVYSFGAANAVRVTQAQVNPWSLGDIFCVETAGGGDGGDFPDLPNSQNTTYSLAARSANIVLEQGENVTCTFSSVLIDLPVAASISGRITTETGLPVSRALISIQNVTRNETRIVYANAFGYYRFNDLQAYDQYVLTVSHGKRDFPNNSRSITLNGDLSGVNFVAVY